MTIVIHPRFAEKAGAGDIVRHFQVRGFDVGNVPGSRFMHVEPKVEPPPVRPPPTVRLYRPRFHFWPLR